MRRVQTQRNIKGYTVLRNSERGQELASALGGRVAGRQHRREAVQVTAASAGAENMVAEVQWGEGHHDRRLRRPTSTPTIDRVDGPLRRTGGNEGGVPRTARGGVVRDCKHDVGKLVSSKPDEPKRTEAATDESGADGAEGTTGRDPPGWYSVETRGFHPAGVDFLDEGADLVADRGTGARRTARDSSATAAAVPAAAKRDAKKCNDSSCDAEQSGSADDESDEYNGPRRLIVIAGGELVDPDGYVAIAKVGKFQWRVSPIVATAGSDSEGDAVASEQSESEPPPVPAAKPKRRKLHKRGGDDDE